MSEGM